MIEKKTPGLTGNTIWSIKWTIMTIQVILISLLLSSISLANHHINCNDPINSIFPECKVQDTTDKEQLKTHTAACIAVIDPTNFQITFDWLDVIGSSGVISSLKNITIAYKSGTTFTLIDAVSVTDEVKPEDLNCQNAFNIETLSLSVPALKIGSNNIASYENLLFSYQSGLDFSIKNIDEIKSK